MSDSSESNKFSKSIETEWVEPVWEQKKFIRFKCHASLVRFLLLCRSTRANTHKLMNGSCFLCANKTPRYVVWFHSIFLCLLLLNCDMLAMLIVSTRPICSHIAFYGFYFHPIPFVWWCNVMVLPLRAHSITVTFSSYEWHLATSWPLAMNTLRICIDLCETRFCWELCST